MAAEITTDPKKQDGDLHLYRVADIMLLLNLSRTVIYEQLRAGRLRSVRQGRARLIPGEAVRDYIKLLQYEAEKERK